MAAVAEVEDPGNAVPLVEQEVVEVEVAVDDLGAQAFPLRQHARLEAVERASDQCAPLRLGDLLEQRAQPWGFAEVPEQLTRGRGVEERPQREAEASVHGGDCVHRRVIEVRAGLPAAPPFEQPHEVAVERRVWRERPRDRQLRVDRHDVCDRRFLQVEDGFFLAAVRDLLRAHVIGAAAEGEGHAQRERAV